MAWVKLTARVTLDAYDAITELQRRHRRRTGRALRLWEVVDAAIIRQSKQIKGSGRTYFLDVEKTKEGKPYLRITESRKGEGGRGSVRAQQHQRVSGGCR